MSDQNAPPPPAVPQHEVSWLDKQFANTHIIILALAAFCCSGPALIFSIIGVAACKDPKAKRNAIIMLAISGLLTLVLIISYATQGTP